MSVTGGGKCSSYLYLSWTPVDFSDMFRELRRLKEEKYDLKFKQRLTALIAGDLLYFTGVWYYFISPNL